MAERFDRVVRFSTFVRATKEKVFDALATSEGLDEWLRPGRFAFQWPVEHGARF
jgi:uncharacterized protein YndB with AHSA1/START domain